MTIRNDAIYDGADNTTQHILPMTAIGGSSVPGTAASDTVLTRVRVPRKMTVVGGGVLMVVGGTAAGPNIAVGKSLAGTGTVAQFGTHAHGTDANLDHAALTVTETEFDAGDFIVLTNLAGTAASTPTSAVNLVWKGDVD